MIIRLIGWKITEWVIIGLASVRILVVVYVWRGPFGPFGAVSMPVFARVFFMWAEWLGPEGWLGLFFCVRLFFFFLQCWKLVEPSSQPDCFHWAFVRVADFLSFSYLVAGWILYLEVCEAVFLCERGVWGGLSIGFFCEPIYVACAFLSVFCGFFGRLEARFKVLCRMGCFSVKKKDRKVAVEQFYRR